MLFRASKSSAEDLSPYGAGHALARPELWRAGVVFASPHSGSIYPDAFIRSSKLSAHELRRNEDVYIDRLFASAVPTGAPFLRALFPRVIVDVNRAADELPMDWVEALGLESETQPSLRAAAGLGVVPTYLSETLPIYTNLPKPKDVQARIDRLYTPYHAALKAVLDESVARFGRALLVDCHSMPGFAPMGARRPDIILGDRFGVSCRPETLSHIRQSFARAGYSVGVNYPYAGGFTTTHYGKPADGIEAIQIEVNRDLYVNPVTLARKSGYERLQHDLRGIIADIIEMALPQELAAQ